MKPKLVFLLATLVLAIASSTGFAQAFLPPPRPAITGGFTNSPALMPATVVAQSSLAPIPSNNALRPQPAPFNSSFGGYLGGGYLLYYPAAYSYPVFNPSVNVNLSVVPPQPEYSPVYRINPLYGVPPVEPVSTTTARLILQVPTDSEVWVNGEKTPLTGTRRVFESPKLTGGKPFDFEVKVSWLENDKRQNEERKLSLGAGESRTLVILSNPAK